MKNFKIKTVILLACFSIMSCTKNEPTIEVDQEEISIAKLLFTEVNVRADGDAFQYENIPNPHEDSVIFKGPDFLADANKLLEFEVGKTYRFQLKVIDFASRESQNSFTNAAEQHFVFWLNAPNSSVDIVYMDKNNVGEITPVGTIGYITILKETSTFNWRYILRHLNPGVKNSIDLVKDIQNVDFAKFSGANDIDVVFPAHFIQ